MSSKRRATSAVEGATKALMASRASTSGPATQRGDSSDDDSQELSNQPNKLNKAIAGDTQTFDISAFPYLLPPSIVDTASGFLQPKQERDFTTLPLKPNYHNWLLRIDGWWGFGGGGLILESFHPLAPRVQDFLITIAESVHRNALDRFLKNQMPPNVVEYIMRCGKSYGKVKMVLRDKKYFVETADLEGTQEIPTTSAPTMAGLTIAGTKEAAGMREAAGLDKSRLKWDQTGQDPTAEKVYGALGEGGDDGGDDKVGTVAQRCLALHYPALEEYDFRNDHINANLEIDLRPGTQIRPYQEKSLSKMFGNGRVKSGIIVLPCGAGKPRVGVTAAYTIKKGVVVLATSNMSVIQWRNKFIKWSNINLDNIAILSSDK
ncbi:hypothetical protein QBC33DRAFT_580125 [Phialemonium atrogriseum]|uniref:Helicase/UvrB N-terminal domain-containing protein n=1 Tax=Phialemonium atrogriseum TaxID=1093897 RepID=A0AAJ0BUR0_9PEZI|nr:uncharacterized protein QBC33DRAFT_580125 [Phialemonium atrogriseum]KAK1764855.1 hypothetical protein QBC33DRAFT_580125 [Phialemonium atrogriseum]